MGREHNSLFKLHIGQISQTDAHVIVTLPGQKQRGAQCTYDSLSRSMFVILTWIHIFIQLSNIDMQNTDCLVIYDACDSSCVIWLRLKLISCCRCLIMLITLQTLLFDWNQFLNQFYCYINAVTSLVSVQTAAAVAADELILCDPAHLRPRIVMRPHYNGITFLLIKMGKVTQRAFTFGSVALGCRHMWGFWHRPVYYTLMHIFAVSKREFIKKGKIK